jgi:hypothetical protein
MTDDHGDQFPGALPAAGLPDTAHHAAADERVVRMRADYLQKANSLVQAGRDDLAHELASSFEEESAGASTAVRRSPGRRTPTRGQGGRRPQADTRLGRMSRLTRSSLRRFDRYTLDVFNAGTRYDRTER